MTQAQYAAWLALGPQPELQDAKCAWNADFAPAVPDDCPQLAPSTDSDSRRPVVCVDWCDAYSYCKGVGKRLCGRIGGGPVAYDDYASVDEDQWYNACSSGGLHSYPYGDQYSAVACNSSDNGCVPNACRTTLVGSLAGCASEVPGYGGVYDLSANVDEWEDSCDGDSGPDDICRHRGGSLVIFNGPELLRCDAGNETWRQMVWYSLGFRCCSP